MDKWLSNKFNWLSLVATWAVVCIHSRTDRWAPVCHDYAWAVQRQVANAFHFAVPLFFLIAGYMFVRSYEAHGWRELIRRKFWSLYLPVTIWTIVGVVLCLPIRLWTGSDVPTLLEVIEVPAMIYRSEGMHFWFVRALVILTLVAPPLVFALRRWVLAVILVACSVCFIRADSWAAVQHVDMAIVYFLVGGMIRQYFGGACRRLQMVEAMALALGSCGLIVLSFKFQTCFSNHVMVTWVFPILEIIFVWSVYDMIDHLVGVVAIPGWLGGHFFIYCMHLMTLCWMGGILRVVFGVGPCSRLVSYFLLFGTFWIDCVISYGVSRRFPRVYGVLSGGR